MPKTQKSFRSFLPVKSFVFLSFLVWGLLGCGYMELCSSSAPDVFLLRDRNTPLPVAKMLWLYESGQESDTVELELTRMDTSFVKYHQSDLRDICSNEPWACDIFIEEMKCTYQGSEKLSLIRWVNALGCLNKFDLILNGDSLSFFIGDDGFHGGKSYNSRLSKHIVKSDSGLVFYRDKVKGISVKRIR